MALMDKVKGILGIPEDADEMYDDENLVEGETIPTESTNVKLYFDRSSSAVFSDDKTVVIHSMKFVCLVYK